MSNYVQPNVFNPVPNPLVGIPGIIPVLHGEALGLPATPLTRYIENVSAKDDPQGTIKTGKSGKGSKRGIPGRSPGEYECSRRTSRSECETWRRTS